MNTFIKGAVLTTATVMLLGLSGNAHAQGIYLGPGGVGIDRGYDVDRGRRDYGDEDRFRRHRDHRREFGFGDSRFRDRSRDGDSYGYRRRHRFDDEQRDSER